MKVQIENHNGRLRLRWDDDNKVQTVTVGLPDSPINRKFAVKKKEKIERDWNEGEYDFTVVKYRSQTLGKNATEISAPELFQRFADYQLKHKGLSVSSIESRYKPIVRMLEKHLNKPVNQIGKHQVNNFAAICQKSFSGQTSKERCWLLHSCWEWAKGKYQVAPGNPWVGIAARFRVIPRQQVKPFTVAELQAILSALDNHPRFCHYSEFVSFLINTACRFGEGAGLRWKSLSADFSTVWIGESISRRHGTTKTGKARTVMISGSTRQTMQN